MTTANRTVKKNTIKIRVSDIPPRGLEVVETGSLETLNARLKEGSECDIVFTQTPLILLKVQKTISGAETTGTIKSAYRQPCSLCLKELDQVIEIPANFIFKLVKPQEIKSSQDLEKDFEEDIGITYFTGDHIEIEDLIEETLILQLSIYLKPERDKSGKCLRCGINPILTKEPEAKTSLGKFSLGTILEKAKSSKK